MGVASVVNTDQEDLLATQEIGVAVGYVDPHASTSEKTSPSTTSSTTELTTTTTTSTTTTTTTTTPRTTDYTFNNYHYNDHTTTSQYDNVAVCSNDTSQQHNSAAHHFQPVATAASSHGDGLPQCGTARAGSVGEIGASTRQLGHHPVGLGDGQHPRLPRRLPAVWRQKLQARPAA
ncbi:hypothetical protein LSTR_LSTR017579 [Laodelphax striatellus]|uniref:Uncharacterized protein n=1 Tax=Laodelphax striatellus TaxID=195883 RepID=A0A482XVY5_LAOST|nr:hypothetical protein LSTR_LSTR017579 [Laodelphax striatellus]